MSDERENPPVEHDGLRVPRSDEWIVPIVRPSTLGWEICKDPDPNAGASFIIEDVEESYDPHDQ